MAANSIAIGPASADAKIAVRVDPAASSTARTSSVHSSQVGTSLRGTSSDPPVPRRSNRMSRLNFINRARNAAYSGMSQKCSKWLPSSVEVQEVEVGVADGLVGDVGVAHGYVSRHGRLGHRFTIRSGAFDATRSPCTREAHATLPDLRTGQSSTPERRRRGGSAVAQGVVAVMRYGTPPPRPRSGRGSAATETKPAAVSRSRIGSGRSRCMSGSSLLVSAV